MNNSKRRARVIELGCVEKDVELGADELMARVEWELRDQPDALRKQRRKYIDFCMDLCRELYKARRG